MTSHMIDVTVNGLAGQICSVPVRSPLTLCEIKREVEKKSGIPKAEQRLLLDSEEVYDSEGLLKGMINLRCYPPRFAITLTLVRRTQEQIRWMELVRHHKLTEAPADIRADNDVLLEAFTFNAAAKVVAWMDVKKLEDRDFILKLFRQSSKAVRGLADYVGPALFSDREVVAAGLQTHPGLLEKASTELQSDRDIVSCAVAKDGHVLKYASVALKKDPGVILAAAKNYCGALKHVSCPKLRRSSDFILALLQASCSPLPVLEFASEEIRDMDEVILLAIAKGRVNECRLLFYASDRLRGDRNIVMSAVRKSGFALQFASKELCSDFEVVLTAVQQTPSSLQFALGAPLADRAIVQRAVVRDGECLRYASQDMKCDRALVMECIRDNVRGASCFEFASGALRADPKFVASAVGVNPRVLRYASEDLKNNVKIAQIAMKKDANIFPILSGALRGNTGFAFMAVKKDWQNLAFASDRLRDNKALVLEAVKKSYRATEYASERLKTHRDIMSAAQARRPSGRTPIMVVRALQRKKTSERLAAQASKERNIRKAQKTLKRPASVNSSAARPAIKRPASR